MFYCLTLKYITMRFFLPIIICLVLCSCKLQRCEYNQIQGFTQGTTYSIIYENCESIDYTDTITAILKNFDLSLSEYEPQSIISRINANDPTVKVDEHFKTVFLKSKEIWEKTDGLMDITVGPIINALGFGPSSKVKVDSAQIKQLLQYVGLDKVRLEGDHIVKADTAIKLDVNSIAQGYSVDVVSNFLISEGVDNFLVEIGGEVRAKGKNPDGEYWRVGIEKPEDNSMGRNNNIQEVVSLKNLSLTTSGNYHKFFVENGVKYTHIVNPKTGFPSHSNLLSVTIVAKDALTADGWDTGLMVMGLEKSIAFLKEHTELDAYLIYSDQKGNMKVYMTDGLRKMIAQ